MSLRALKGWTRWHLVLLFSRQGFKDKQAMERIGVDCLFDEEGSARVRRIAVDGQWKGVEQGRQWLDEAGRHVLIMLDGRDVREIVLQREELVWVMKARRGPQIV